jgi:DNA-binding LacI/PurR family transcriptional regulator
MVLESKYEMLKRCILEDIKQGVLKEGDRVPPQREMEELYSVSRITVKKAIVDLIQDNVLEHQEGKKGIFVKQRKVHSNNSKTIAVVLDDITSYYDSNLLKGIEDSLWKQNYHTILCNANRNMDKVDAYFQTFDFSKIDGIIFLPVVVENYKERNRKILKLFRKKGVPFVLIDQYIPGEPANLVATDHRNGAREICRALIDKGHEKILMGCGVDCFSVEERIVGFRDAHIDAGLNLDSKRILKINDNLLKPHSDPNPDEMHHIEDLIRQAGDFTAFYAINNRIMKAVVLTMEKLGYDLSKIQLALHNEVNKPVPPYTDNIPHIVPHLHQIGYEASNLLLKVINTNEEHTVQLIINSRLELEGLK